MQLESLANELLLDLFELLNGVHLLLAFYDLNSRFDNLLFTHFRSNPLDFRRVSKTDFDLVCQHQHLPSLVDRITSLCLSDNDETPHQTHRFLSHHLTLGQFIHVQSLSLSHIDSEPTMNQMMDELNRLSHLRHLIVIDCYFQSSYVDSIWCLSGLIRCELKNIRNIDWSQIPTVKSFSLQHFSILDSSLRRFSFRRLLEYTPGLRHLAAALLNNPPSEQRTSLIPSIETVSLSFLSLTHGLEDLVAHMPNLSQLTVGPWGDTYVDGYQWEKMITDHLPKLKVFRLRMEFTLEDDIGGEEQVNQILDSFRTRFWIDGHQWFVRCHWKSRFRQNSYWLYTLPYAFRWFDLDLNTHFKSTCAEDASCHLYDRLHGLDISQHYLSSDFFRLRFSKLHRLPLRLPIQDDFWSVVPTLDRLTSLIVYFASDGPFLPQLQRLLDRAPSLYSLAFTKDPTFHVVNLTSKSIRRLSFTNCAHFNEQTCIALSQSSLGMQCECLVADVEDKTNIVYLVNNMQKSLCVTF